MTMMSRKYYLCYLLLIGFILSGCTPGVGIQDFFIRFNALAGTFHRLVTGITYLIGLTFAFRAIYALKLYGEARTMMSNHANMKIPAIYTFVAAVFMYLPTAVGTANQALFGSDVPLSYHSTLINPSQLYMTGLLAFVRVVGLISFVRGWMFLAAHAQQGGHQNSVGKALTHIIGGVFAYNIEATMDLIRNPF